MLYIRYFRSKDTHRQKLKGWKKIFQANRNKKKDGVTIPISEKNRFWGKDVIKGKEGHYIVTKGQSKRRL